MVKVKKDANKNRAELIKELDALRDHNYRLNNVIGRYERVLTGKGPENATQCGGRPSRPEEINACGDGFARINTALRESEEKFRALAESTNAGIVLFRDDRYIYVNPMIEKALGYTKDELLSMNTWDIIHPDSRELVRMRGHERLQGRPVPSRYEVKVLTKGGKTIWAEFSAAVIDYEGRPTAIATIFDITERKRAEEERDRLFEYSRDILFIVGFDGRFKVMSPSVEKTLGWKKEEFLGKHFIDFTHPEDRALTIAMMKEHENGREAEFENRVLCKDGSYRWISWNAHPLVAEKMAIGVGRDVTDRKRTVKALMKDRYILTKSQEVAHVGNWAWNLETGELTGSAENDRIFGYEPGMIEPGIEWLLSRVLPEDRAAMADFIAARSRDGQRGSIDYRVRRPDGSVAYVNTIVDKSVRDRSGRVTRLYGISQDVTERKRAEEELKAAKLQAELYVDLMGHDISNMHQIALGYLELAREMPRGAEQAALLDKSEEVLKRSTKLIGNVRKLQKLHEGAFQSRDIDVCKALVDAQSEYEAVPGKSITLDLHGHKTCIVRANELLHDVFTNLVNNAVKHIKDGKEITISLDTTEEKGKQFCRVAVEDNGPGIPDAFKERVFNRMHQGTASGTGLGLYLVKSLVKSYGGRVWAEDRVPGCHSQGARFVVSLPSVKNRKRDPSDQSDCGSSRA